MDFFKKKVTELDASLAFTQHVLNSAKAGWPDIYTGLREAHGSGFVVDDEAFAIFDLCLAAIAQDMEALQNLFSVDQADRLRRWVLNVMNSTEYGEYCAQEIETYRAAWREALDSSEPRDAMNAIPALLLHRWLGSRLREFTIQVAGQRSDIISPLLVTHVMTIVMGFVGFWKRFKEQYRLVPSDLPPDHKFRSR